MIKYLILLFWIIFCNPISDKHYILHKPSKVILITIDGTRYQDIFDGLKPGENANQNSRSLIPNIYHYFIDNGMAIGKLSQARVSGPIHISQPGYLEITRGYITLDCFTNTCPQNTEPTIIDQFPNNAAVITSWEILRKIFNNDYAIVNTGKLYRNQKWNDLNLPIKQEIGEDFDDQEYRADIDTIRAAQDYLSKRQDKFVWLGFGDTDEHCHSGKALNYIKSLQQIDNFIKELIEKTERDTTFIISPDHGRGDDWTSHGIDDASARVFILLYGANIPAKGFVKYQEIVHLSNIYPTIMDLAKNVKSSNSLLRMKTIK